VKFDSGGAWLHHSSRYIPLYAYGGVEADVRLVHIVVEVQRHSLSFDRLSAVAAA